jgi:hypothetical protein
MDINQVYAAYQQWLVDLSSEFSTFVLLNKDFRPTEQIKYVEDLTAEEMFKFVYYWKSVEDNMELYMPTINYNIDIRI